MTFHQDVGILSTLSDSYTANIQRGTMLLERNRFEEALPFLQQALVSDPNNGWMLSQVALCQSHIEDQRRTAIATINAAIAAEPETAMYFGLKAIILCRINEAKMALKAADRGIALAPDDSFVYAARAQALLGLDRWQEAETAARMALTLDADDPLAANQLVQALYERRDGTETHTRVVELLANDPEDAHTHYNAGYSFLQKGDVKRSLEHFTECLRLDPSFQIAKIGMLGSPAGPLCALPLVPQTAF